MKVQVDLAVMSSGGYLVHCSMRACGLWRKGTMVFKTNPTFTLSEEGTWPMCRNHASRRSLVQFSLWTATSQVQYFLNVQAS